MNDLVSRQWLMECVNEGWIKFDTEKDENRFIHLVRDMAPPAQPEQRWIPVTERLPEEDVDVLVCNENGFIEITSGSYSTEMKDFMWCTSGWRFGKVIAWMPLPKPYAEGERG